MPHSYGLVRVSDPRQVRHGHSIPQQTERIKAAGDSMPDAAAFPWADTSFIADTKETRAAKITAPPGFYIDAGESAYSKNLKKRPAGKSLLGQLQRGDRVIVTRIDRVWRTMRDFCNTMREFERLGVRLICLDPKIDFGTAVGRLLAHLLVAFAEFESAIKGERMREAFAAKRARAAASGDPVDTEKKRKKRQPRAFKLREIDGDFRPPPLEFLKQSKTGRVYIYLRCSHWDSVKSGLGLDAQFDSAMREAQRFVDQTEHLAFGGVFKDEAVSAFKIPFAQREKAGELCRVLKPGDMVILPRLDRGFRNTRDLLNTVPEWIERGITLRIVDQNLDFSQWSGKFVLTALGMAAELEAAIASARQKDIAAWLRAHGRVGAGGRAPLFFRIENCGGSGRRVIWDRTALTEFRCAMRLRSGGLTWEKTAERLEHLRAKREGRPPIPVNGMMPPNGRGSKRWDSRRKDRRQGARLIHPKWRPDVVRDPKIIEVYRESLKLYRTVRRKRRLRGDAVLAEVTERRQKLAAPSA